MASPSPVPLSSSFVVKNGSMTRGRCSAVMPAPVSANSSTTARRPSSRKPGARRNVSVPPSGMASPAFVSRFRKTCRKIWRSAWITGTSGASSRATAMGRLRK